MKSIYIYLNKAPKKAITTYLDTIEALNKNEEIYTTQLDFASTTFLIKGYRVFVVKNDKEVEFKIGMKEKNTIELRLRSSLPNMIKSGVYDVLWDS